MPYILTDDAISPLCVCVLCVPCTDKVHCEYNFVMNAVDCYVNESN